MGSMTFLGSNSVTLFVSTPWVGKIPWRREWQPTPVFLPGDSHGQRRLMGYSPGVAKSWTQLSNSHFHTHRRFPRELGGKEFICQYKSHRRCKFDPWVWKIPWRRKWQSTLVFLSGEFHRQRSLAGYSPRGGKESDPIEQTHVHTHMSFTDKDTETCRRGSCIPGHLESGFDTSSDRPQSRPWSFRNTGEGCCQSLLPTKSCPLLPPVSSTEVHSAGRPVGIQEWLYEICDLESFPGSRIQ